MDATQFLLLNLVLGRGADRKEKPFGEGNTKLAVCSAFWSSVGAGRGPVHGSALLSSYSWIYSEEGWRGPVEISCRPIRLWLIGPGCCRVWFTMAVLDNHSWQFAQAGRTLIRLSGRGFYSSRLSATKEERGQVSSDAQALWSETRGCFLYSFNDKCGKQSLLLFPVGS